MSKILRIHLTFEEIQLLRETVETRNLTLLHFARNVGLSRQYLHLVFRQKASLSLSHATAIYESLGRYSSLDFLADSSRYKS